MKINLTTILTIAILIVTALTPLFANPGDLYASDDSLVGSIRKYAPDGTETIFASGLRRPRGLAFDRFGNLYASTLDTSAPGDYQGRILKFAPDGSYTTFASGLLGPEQIVFDRAGNLFAVSAGNINAPGLGGLVYKIARDGTVTTFTNIGNSTEQHQFFGAAFNYKGNLFVADDIANVIYMMTNTAKISIFASVNTPVGLAFGSAGDLYTSDYADGTIIKITPDGSQSTFAMGLGDTRGLAFDAYGNLFVAGHGSNNIYEIAPDGTVSTFATGLVVPQFLAFEPIFPPPPPAPTPAHPTPPPVAAIPSTHPGAPAEP